MYANKCFKNVFAAVVVVVVVVVACKIIVAFPQEYRIKVENRNLCCPPGQLVGLQN